MLDVIRRRTVSKLVTDFIFSGGDTTPLLQCYKFPIFEASRICRGEKYFEYRNYALRVFPDVMVLYDCAPYSAIIALVEVEAIYSGDRYSIWEETHDGAGIEYEDYIDYANEYCTFAYKLGKVRELGKPVTLRELGDTDLIAKGIQRVSVPTVNKIIQLSATSLFG